MKPTVLWNLAVRFTTAWNRDRWELVVLSIPLTRAMLFSVGLAPTQLNDEVIGPPWQLIALLMLGVTAAVAVVGVMGKKPIVERAGLHALGPISVLYGLGSIVSDPGRGSVTLVVYGMIAACCFARAREITKSMRIVNRALSQGAGTGQR